MTTTSIIAATSQLTSHDRWLHVLARVGIRRDQLRVVPGLYALDSPTPDSPVFVTANYQLSFDALRSALDGIAGYILVLDTFGINVWCAAGKGTFGTTELIQRIQATGLAQVVTHRKLILPQLGAPGVAADQVRRATGFRVTFGPVRAADLPEFLRTGAATPAMRRVRFDLKDRLVLIPVEMVHTALPTLAAAVGLYFLSGWLPALAAVAAVLGGVVLMPILLPWLPAKRFSIKGFMVGGALAVVFAVWSWLRNGDLALWQRIGWVLGYLLAMPPVSAYLALNFTGSTPITSRTGVAREIKTFIPLMAGLFAPGIMIIVALSILHLMGG
ncbi:MAG: carbon monoxide dehydrogenase [Chloroflexi bacterium]|nr:carbon monoxide dehydrogenase [Chloroflexota bacterium]